MPVPPSRLAVAAVALVDDLASPTRVLAARRTEPPLAAGGWEFPGGKVEPGEPPPQAAVREVLEELGVRVRLGRRVVGPLGRPDDPEFAGAWPLGESAALHLWWAVPLPGEPAPRPLQDHDELRWLTRSDLHDVAWLAADRPIVEHLVGLLHT